MDDNNAESPETLPNSNPTEPMIMLLVDIPAENLPPGIPYIVLQGSMILDELISIMDVRVVIDIFRMMRKPPAAQHIRDNLPDETVKKEVVCPICLTLHDVGEVLKKLPCNHLFDEDCILSWLKEQNTCPSCRKELETDNEVYEEFKKFVLENEEG